MNVTRYGNKGIISDIVEDELMPRLDNGKHVEIIFNTLGVINRLNSQQLFEQSINFICNRTVEHFATLDTREEKFDILYRIICHFNDKQACELKEYYENLTTFQQNEFFEEMNITGIFVHIPPLWEKEPLFDRIHAIYKEFDFIKPYDVYVRAFGRDIKIMRPMVIGDMYILKLKQSSKKGFSARATGSISKKGLPEKANNNNSHNEPYSKTPIRIGVQENTNAIIGVPSEIVAKLHKFYRSSVEARQNLGVQLSTSIDPIEVLEDDPSFRNRNVDIFNAYTKAMGWRVVFESPEDQIIVDDGTMITENYHDQMIIGTPLEIQEQVKWIDAKESYDKDYTFVGTQEEYDQRIKQRKRLMDLESEQIIIDID